MAPSSFIIVSIVHSLLFTIKKERTERSCGCLFFYVSPFFLLPPLVPALSTMLLVRPPSFITVNKQPQGK
ncbi:MAG: hypothetical protein JOS17DRAFT_766099 [Linnemannia elongata]|nr:MAG: hypothetical protein JOS17DRAFT_766099 [Linnemannia elongata]